MRTGASLQLTPAAAVTGRAARMVELPRAHARGPVSLGCFNRTALGGATADGGHGLSPHGGGPPSGIPRVLSLARHRHGEVRGHPRPVAPRPCQRKPPCPSGTGGAPTSPAGDFPRRGPWQAVPLLY